MTNQTKIIIGVVAVAGIGYFLYKRNKKQTATQPVTGGVKPVKSSNARSEAARKMCTEQSAMLKCRGEGCVEKYIAECMSANTLIK